MIIKYCRITMQKQTIIMRVQDNYVKFFTRINNVYTTTYFLSWDPSKHWGIRLTRTGERDENYHFLILI